MATIYHGTPMSPRDALLSVCAGRAIVVSFYRPDDAEAVEAISPAIMFRQWRVFVLAAGPARRAGMGVGSRLDALFRMAGAAPVSSGQVGNHPRQSGRTFPTQRCATQRVALRTERRAALAHGWADRAVAASLREIRPGMPWMDRAEGWLAGLSRAHGRSGPRARQSLARHPHDARNGGGLRLPLRQRGQHFTSSKRVAL
jgi:hypothetical protein